MKQLQMAAPDELSQLSITYSGGCHGDQYDSPGHGYHSDTDILHRFHGKHAAYRDSPFHKSYSGYQATIGRLLNKNRDAYSIDINSIDSAHAASIGEEDLSCNSITSPLSGGNNPPPPSTDNCQSSVTPPEGNLYTVTPPTPSTDDPLPVLPLGGDHHDPSTSTPPPINTEDLPSVPPPSYESVIAERTVMIEVHNSQ